MMPTQPNIALLRSGAIGDFVVTLPAISALEEAYPEADLTMIGHPSIVSLSHCSDVRNINDAAFADLYSSGPLREQTRDIFAECDLVIAYSVDPDGQLAKRLSSVVPGKVLVHDPRPAGSVHIVDHLLAPLKRLGIPVHCTIPRIQLNEAEKVYSDGIFLEHRLREPLVMLHTGSGGLSKCWPTNNYQLLASCLHNEGVHTLFLHGPCEIDRGHQRPDGTVDLVPPTLMDLAGLLSRASLFIGNDSGPAHISAAVGSPTLTLFGPTDPVTWGPRSPFARHLAAENGDLNRLTVDAVMERASEILEDLNSSQ